MGKTTYRGHDIERNADGTYSARKNGIDIATAPTEDAVMNKVDALLRAARLAQAQVAP